MALFVHTCNSCLVNCGTSNKVSNEARLGVSLIYVITGESPGAAQGGANSSALARVANSSSLPSLVDVMFIFLCVTAPC